MTTRNLLDQIYNYLNRRKVYHPLFWVVLYGIMIFTGLRNTLGPVGRISFVVGNEFISLLFHMVLVYVNLLYLIPRYLAKHVLVYLGWVVLICGLVTPVKVLALYLKMTGYPDFQHQIIKRQGAFFWGNVFVVLVSTLLRVIMDWWRYQGEKHQLVAQTVQTELRFLKSQINPHFLFNTLNNLYALTLKKSDKAPEIVLKLSEIMRYMLYECNEKRVLLTKEIQYIHNYLDLERLRQTAKSEIVFTTEGHISDQQVAPLLFVPFLENSFKHGLNHHVQGDGFVRMHLKVENQELEFFIENSKPEGMPRQEHPASGGIGLANVQQRLRMLYPENHILKIQNEPHRYAVTLRLKMI